MHLLCSKSISIIATPIDCMMKPLWYVTALGFTGLVHWLILVAPLCLWSHNAWYIMLKSFNKTQPRSICSYSHHYYTPASTKLNVCPYVRPSVCLWTQSCPLCIFNNTRWIPSSNFRRCVMGNVSFKVKKYVILANSLILWLWIGLCLTWDPICLNKMGNHEAAGVSSERRGSSCSSY